MVTMTDLRAHGLILTEEQWNCMLADVAERAPEEACGLLAGKGNVVHTVSPVTNILHSPSLYRMAPEEQLAVFNQIDRHELDLIGIYHSHPNGPQGLSQRDLTEAYYPDVIQLVWFRQGDEWQCHGSRIVGDRVVEVSLSVLRSE
jgi:proteasome lid subunit RPN8/RPN11